MKKNLYMDSVTAGYAALGAAIVRQAVQDYQDAGNNSFGRKTRKEVSEFIKSPFFQLLTSIDPEYMLRVLKHREGVRQMSISELARKYNVSRRTIYRMIQDGRINMEQEVVNESNVS